MIVKWRVAALSCGFCSTTSARWASSEGSGRSGVFDRAARYWAPPEAYDAARAFGAAFEKLQSSRPLRAESGRAAPEVLDLLLLAERDRRVGVLEAECDVDAAWVRWCWRHASSAYGFAPLKAFGLLKGVYPSSLSEAASMRKLDLLALASRCGDSTTLIEGRWKMAPHYGGVCAPAFFVAYSADRHCVVVSVRGTADVGDVLTDLACTVRPLASGRRAHAGILASALAVLRDAAPAVSSALEQSRRASALTGAGPATLVLTGHSMGGGVCLLMAALLDDDEHACSDATCVSGEEDSSSEYCETDVVECAAAVALARELRAHGHALRVVAFSPPPVLSDGDDAALGALLTDAAARPLSDDGRCESYFVSDDVVPSLSLRTVLELAREIDEIDAEVSPRARVALLAKIATSKARESLVSSALFSIRGQEPRERAVAARKAAAAELESALAPALARAASNPSSEHDAPTMRNPGRMVRISREGTATLVDGSKPLAIRLRDRAIRDHLPPVLEAAIEALFARPPKGSA